MTTITIDPGGNVLEDFLKQLTDYEEDQIRARIKWPGDVSEQEIKDRATLNAVNTAKKIDTSVRDAMLFLLQQVHERNLYHFDPDEPETFLDYLLQKLPEASGGEQSDILFLCQHLLPRLAEKYGGYSILIKMLGQRPEFLSNLRAAVSYLRRHTTIWERSKSEYEENLKALNREVRELPRRIDKAEDPQERKQLTKELKAKTKELEEKQNGFDSFMDDITQRLGKATEEGFKVVSTPGIKAEGPGGVRDILAKMDGKEKVIWNGYYRPVPGGRLRFSFEVPESWLRAIELALPFIHFVVGETERHEEGTPTWKVA